MARPTFEACGSLVIPVRLIVAHMMPNRALVCRMTFQADSKPFIIAVTIDMRAAPIVELAHIERRSDGRPVRYRIGLISTPQRFGGVRWWFQCPRSGRRATKLVLPRGGDRFASRGAWGLGYASQRAGKLEKISRRAGRTYRSIGGKGNWRDGLPDKPRWMRWPTYSKRVLVFRALVAEHNATWVAEVVRAFPRLRIAGR